MNDSLNIYNVSELRAYMDGSVVTIKGVQLADILNEYSVEEIVDALCDASKDADVFDELAKRSEEE